MQIFFLDLAPVVAGPLILSTPKRAFFTRWGRIPAKTGRWLEIRGLDAFAFLGTGLSTPVG